MRGYDQHNENKCRFNFSLEKFFLYIKFEAIYVCVCVCFNPKRLSILSIQSLLFKMFQSNLLWSS